MSLKDTLQKSLSPELFNNVTEALGDTFNYDVVPRTRLNEVIEQRNTATKQIDELTAQLSTQKGKFIYTEEQVSDLKKEWQTEADKKLTEVQVKFKVLDKLKAAAAVDAELIWNGGLVDATKLTLDDDKGIETAVEDLKKNKPHLFGAGDNVQRGTGKHGGEADPAGVDTLDKFMKLNVTEQLEFKTKHPTVFKKFMDNL